MKFSLTAILAASLLFGFGCDDDDDNASNTKSDAGVSNPNDPKESFILTEIHLSEPSKVAGLLTTLLNNNLRDQKMYLFVQLEDRDGKVMLRGGAGQYVSGKDTHNDRSDDVFDWLTEGNCLTSAGESFHCAVDVGCSETIQNADGTFDGILPILNIYSDDSEVVFPIKQAKVHGVRNGNDLHVDMSGVVTEKDSLETHFRLSASSPAQSLKSVLDMVGSSPDTTITVDGEELAAYTFSGTLETTLTGFVAETKVEDTCPCTDCE